MKLTIFTLFVSTLSTCAAVMLVANAVRDSDDQRVSKPDNVSIRIGTDHVVRFNVRRQLISECANLTLHNEYVMAAIVNDQDNKCYIRIKTSDRKLDVQASSSLLAGFTTVKFDILTNQERFLTFDIFLNGSVTVNEQREACRCDQGLGTTRNITVQLSNTSKCTFYFNFEGARINEVTRKMGTDEDDEDNEYLNYANTVYMSLLYGAIIFGLIMLP